MTAPTFGNVDEASRPIFGAARSRSHPGCVASWGLPCAGPGPHDPPDKPDPATVPAFPELEPAPSLWGAVPEPEPITTTDPLAGPAWRIVDPISGATLATLPPLDVPEHYDPRPDPEPGPCSCGHAYACHELTDGEPGPCWWRAAGLRADGDGFECWCSTYEPDKGPHDAPRPDPEPEPVPRCPTRWSDTETGPLLPCTLPAGHAGKHE